MSTPDSVFDPQRLRVYPRMMVAFYLVAGLALVLSATAMIDVFGKPLGYDFITFWSASHLTLTGDPRAVFDLRAIFGAEQLAVPANKSVFLWHYPPIYQMIVTPLALLPYVLSWFVFVGLGLLAYVVTLRSLFDERLAVPSDAVFLLIAFPGAFLAAFHGQNSLYTAALFVGGLLFFERGRPYLAGLVLGLLIYKPQFGVLLPIAFLASGQWRVLVATGVTAAAMVGLSLLAFGPDQWLAFLANEPLLRRVMEDGLLSWAKMPSAFIFLREFGVPQVSAYVAQGLMAAIAAVCVGMVWRRQGPTRLAWATLISATLLVSPYMFDYEFAVLAPVLVILGCDMASQGANVREKALLILFYVMPLLVAPFVKATHFQVGFLYLLGLLVFCLHRVRRSPVSSLSTRVAI